MQVLYLGRAPRTKETLPNFRDKCRSPDIHECFRGLTDSQRTPRFGASHWEIKGFGFRKCPRDFLEFLLRSKR